MNESIDLNNPESVQILRNSKAGQFLLLSGKIYSARDAAHKKFASSEIDKQVLDLKDKIIYYMGPTPARPGNPIGSCGPTSSYRMDKLFEVSLKLGISATIGKGDRADFCRKLVVEYKSPYLITFGGASAYLAQRVLDSRVVLYSELGAEAVCELTVKDFPVIVGYDIYGNSSLSTQSQPD